MPNTLPPVSRHIWEQKYRLKRADGSVERSIAESWQRVASAVAKAESKAERSRWGTRFFKAMVNFEFLPAGRILSGAGTGRKVTLFNCFVMGELGDNLTAIFNGVKEAALTMQQGGGIGHDFSTLRPEGAPVKSMGADASGPVSFMNVWDAMCRTIMSAGSRRGAMMATLACDHPDIEAFIDAKADPAALRMFNLSVLVSDAFMEAVAADAPWPLTFGDTVYKTLPARALWDKIMRAAYDYAEPGVIFIDRVNRENNLSYCETIRATNPCGEQPLPPYGACLLGSINLARLVRDPFTAHARIDETRLEALTATAVRFLDDVIDVSHFPLRAQAREARAKRRIGLGVTGLADALIFCRAHYGSAEAVRLATRWMSVIERAAYRASAQLAAEKGAFPLYDAAKFAESPGFQRLDDETRALIARHGLRNGTLTSIAPTGTISLLAENVSSGIEPVFDHAYTRRILMPDGSAQQEVVTDYATRVFRDIHGETAALPEYFVTAQELAPNQHLAIQSAFQAHVDASISKTINCPENLSFAAFQDVYREAYALGLKGCTVYRPNPVTGAVLASLPASTPEAGQQTHAYHPPAPLDEAEPFLPLPAPLPPIPASATAGHKGEVVYMSKPLERDQTLPGFTYKLKWGESDHAIYVTINDLMQDGRRRPFEIFINSKNLEHYAWTVALTRMISAVFRRGGDVSFVVEELKAVFDPRGGQWMSGQYVPSLLAAIGGIIEKHMLAIGFLQKEGASAAAVLERLQEDEATYGLPAAAAKTSSTRPHGRTCPRCGSTALHYSEGCLRCRDCDYSKCG